MNDTDPSFIDIEASGLYHNSFPIEIAWSLPDGRIECYLINPTNIPDWQSHWDDNAEAIHGISREQLEREGVDPKWLVVKMNNTLGGKTLYSDNDRFDMEWVKELFFVCGKVPVRFYIKDAIPLFNARLKEQGNKHIDDNEKSWDFDGFKQYVTYHHQASSAHRASNDVSNLQLMWRLAGAKSAS